MKSLRAGTTHRLSGCRRLLQAEGMYRRLVEEQDEELEEVPLKLLLKSSVRWPRWMSSSSSMDICWEARWGLHTCPQHTGMRGSHMTAGEAAESVFFSSLVHMMD